jgi:lipopolysaccharide assembly outer membrane protein LptD (OstA)
VNSKTNMISWLLPVVFLGFLLAAGAEAGDEKSLRLERYAGSFEIIRGGPSDTIFIIGSVVFSWGADTLYADSVQWVKGERVTFYGNVNLRDSVRQLSADKVIYDIRSRIATAFGRRVTLFSASDSLMAVGTDALYVRDSAIYRMTQRSTTYLSYPDSAKMIQIDADRISFDGKEKIGYADGNVIIYQAETESQSERAILYLRDNTLYLYGSPVARRHNSEIKGDSMIIFSEKRSLRRVAVKGNAQGNFKEPTAKDSAIYDVCDLKSSEMEFNLAGNELENILAAGQAYSFYAPGTKDSQEIVRNNSSGDTIKLFLNDSKLQKVQIIGGAEGEYFNGKYKSNDSGRIFLEDTVIYRSDSIEYTLSDTTIRLVGQAAVENKTLSLTAHRIRYNTARGLVTAFDDSSRADTDTVWNYIPVVLKDGTEEMIGSYLEYSMNTQRGMLRQSKTEYQDAYYRGKELFREKKDVYYVENGTYSSCDQEEPHFHFKSSHMKMMQGDKIIARPVVFYIEKLPLMIVPYYVFPIKPGRHSGFLPFRIGNFERGAGSISNVGYYWAASQYWDVQASLNYYENYGFAYNSTLRYNIRYYLSGSVTGTYASNSVQSYNQEVKTKRYSIQFNHSQAFSPTFSLKASGNFISDKKYYTDFSTNLNDRLNRDIRSQVSISKRWGNVSLSAQFVHSVALDKETRMDELPSATLSFPSGQIFGTGKKTDKTNTGRKWYENIYLGYSTNIRNYGFRATDTTTGVKSRKEFLTVNHHPKITLSSISLFKYIKVGPSFSYQETWYKVFETDQSRKAGIKSDDYYRRYSYGASLSTSTDLYGTIYPNILGLIGLRHTLTPSATFTWTPEINQHNELKTYTGAGGGGGKQRVMTFSLRQLLHAKVKAGEESKSLELLSISSSTQYNIEAKERKFSALSTNVQTSLLGNLRLTASLTHDLYRPGTNKLHWWSPYLTNFNISTTFSTGGNIGDMEYGGLSDTAKQAPLTGNKNSQRWSFSFSHYYSESKLSALFSKTHTINLNLSFNLTQNWKITYRQSYDIARDKTVSRQVSIERNLHCWQGYFYWIPNGSNRGYYFRLNIISIPDIKFEKSESGIKGMFF